MRSWPLEPKELRTLHRSPMPFPPTLRWKMLFSFSKYTQHESCEQLLPALPLLEIWGIKLFISLHQTVWADWITFKSKFLSLTTDSTCPLKVCNSPSLQNSRVIITKYISIDTPCQNILLSAIYIYIYISHVNRIS